MHGQKEGGRRKAFAGMHFEYLLFGFQHVTFSRDI